MHYAAATERMMPLEPLKLDIRPIVNAPVEILVGLKKDGDFFGIHPVQLLDQEWEDFLVMWGLCKFLLTCYSG